MAPPSQLSIATASVIRLLKEETSYRTELEGQRKRLQILEAESGDDEEGNRAWNIGQEARAPHRIRDFSKLHWKANRRKRGVGTSDTRDRSCVSTVEGKDQHCIRSSGVATGIPDP